MSLRDGNFFLEEKKRTITLPGDEPASSVTPNFKSQQTVQTSKSAQRKSFVDIAQLRTQRTRENISRAAQSFVAGFTEKTFPSCTTPDLTATRKSRQT